MQIEDEARALPSAAPPSRSGYRYGALKPEQTFHVKRAPVVARLPGPRGCRTAGTVWSTS